MMKLATLSTTLLAAKANDKKESDLAEFSVILSVGSSRSHIRLTRGNSIKGILVAIAFMCVGYGLKPAYVWLMAM